MKTENLPRLHLRCFAERQGDQWQAFCIDLGLAAQGDSFEEVKRKLEVQTLEYVYDALAGEDRAHAMELLNRKSPLSIRARYHWYRGKSHAASARDNLYRLFDETLPLTPTDWDRNSHQGVC